MTKSTSPEPAIVVIFGITGDLVARYLLPGLTKLIEAGMVNDKTVFLGTTRQNITTEDLIKRLEKDSTLSKEDLKVLSKKLEVTTVDVTKRDHYDALLKRLNEIEKQNGVCMNRLYYLSVPPQVSEPIVKFWVSKVLIRVALIMLLAPESCLKNLLAMTMAQQKT